MADSQPPSGTCAAVAPGIQLGALSSNEMNETSGLAASRAQPDLLWANNDSGDIARVFAISTAGTLRGEFRLADATFIDAEDMAMGPGPAGVAGDWIYVADIGDNVAGMGGDGHDRVVIYRFPEPVVAAAGGDGDGAPDAVTIAAWEALPMVYPDEPHNAETLLVDPRTGDIYVVTKEGGGISTVFRAAAPLVPGETTTLEAVATLRFGSDQAPGSGILATGGDISPTGDAILIRTYGSMLWWPRAPGQSVAAALSGHAVEAPLTPGGQGETVAFAGDGGGYYTINEGEGAAVWFFGCALSR